MNGNPKRRAKPTPLGVLEKLFVLAAVTLACVAFVASGRVILETLLQHWLAGDAPRALEALMQ